MSETAQPIALSGAYCPRIDGVGTHPTVASTSRRRGICNYLLTAFADDDWDVECRGRCRRLRRRGLFLIQPDRAFSVTMLQGGGWLRWIHFSVLWDPAWQTFDHHLDFNLGKPRRREFLQPDSRRVWGIDLDPWPPAAQLGRYLGWIGDITDLWLGDGAGDRLEANLILGQLLHDWVRQARAREGADLVGESADRLARAERFARRRNGVDVDVAQMARVAGYTRSHFSALFRLARGVGPGTFLRQLRMQEAVTILTTQDLPVRVVGELVGYPNASAFARSFRQHFGCSPERYRLTR